MSDVRILSRASLPVERSAALVYPRVRSRGFLGWQRRHAFNLALAVYSLLVAAISALG